MIKEAASLARKYTASAISIGSAQRLNACSASLTFFTSSKNFFLRVASREISLRSIGVSTEPGLIEFTRIFPFCHLPGQCPGEGQNRSLCCSIYNMFCLANMPGNRMPCLRWNPIFLAFMIGRTYLHNENVPPKFTFTTRIKSDHSISSNGQTSTMPALLIRTSTPPYFLTIWSTDDLTIASSAHITRERNNTSPAESRISFSVFRPSSSLLSSIPTQ